MTLFGKLRELRDRSSSEEHDDRKFFGELVRDNGEVWCIEFKSADEDRAATVFRKHIEVTGKAYYFTTNAPKLVAQSFAVDQARDYEAAFDELYGSDKKTFGVPLSELLRELREEE